MEPQRPERHVTSMHALYGIGITVLLWIASEIIQATTGVSVTPT